MQKSQSGDSTSGLFCSQAWDRSLFGILVRAKHRPTQTLVRSLGRGECRKLWILIKRHHWLFMVAFMFFAGSTASVSKSDAL